MQGGKTITNTTTAAAGDQADPTTTGDDLSEALVVGNDADLVTVKTLASGNAVPAVGDEVSYLITVTNNGPTQATNVTLTDVLPPELTYTSHIAGVGTSYEEPGVWDIGTMRYLISR